MKYSPGDIARAGLGLALPLAGGVLASYGELAWGAAALVVAVAVPRVRRYAAAAGAAFGLLVLARLASGSAAGGVAAVFLGFAVIVAASSLLSLRRRRGEAQGDLPWVAAFTALAAIIAAAAAALFAGPPTLNLILVPLAVGGAVAAVPPGERLSRAALAALTVGVALGAVKGGVGYGLVRAAEAAFENGRYDDAARLAHQAGYLGWDARARPVRLGAEEEGGASWAELEALYGERDRLVSPRPLDAVMARAAFAREDYERAAMYADLATTALPASPVRDRPVSREKIYRDFEANAAGPFAAAWAKLWVGRYDEAASAFASLGRESSRAAWHEAWARERAGSGKEAAALYRELWRKDPRNLRAAFGLLRTDRLPGLRGEIWRNLGRRYETYFVGHKLETAEGYPLTKYRLSLGRAPATLSFNGGGRRPLVVIAEAYDARGLYPIVTLTVNGTPVRTFYLNVTGEEIYETVVNLRPGDNEIGLVYENDYADPDRRLDRNVFLREVRIGHETE